MPPLSRSMERSVATDETCVEVDGSLLRQAVLADGQQLLSSRERAARSDERDGEGNGSQRSVRGNSGKKGARGRQQHALALVSLVLALVVLVVLLLQQLPLLLRP